MSDRRPDGEPGGLLRGHVLRGPHGQARGGQAALAIRRPGQAEVADLRHRTRHRAGRLLIGVRLHQDVGRLQVAMDDALPMRHVDRAGQRLDQPRRLPGRPGVAADPVGQGPAADPLHRQEGVAVMDPHLVDLHDVGVLDAGGQLRLAAEPLPLGFRREAAGQDHLQGHQPPEAAMPGLVDHPHPAPSDLAEDGVLAHVPGRRRARRGLALAVRGVPGLPEQGERRTPPIRLILDDRIRQRPGGLQPPQESVVGQEGVDLARQAAQPSRWSATPAISGSASVPAAKPWSRSVSG